MSARRRSADGLIPRHTTWGVMFAAVAVAALFGIAVGFTIGWLLT